MTTRVRSTAMSGMAVALLWLFCTSPAPGDAAVTCTYTAATKTVEVSVVGDVATIVRSGAAIEMDGMPCGSASVDNTVQIDVTGSASGENVGVDLGGGWFVNPNLPGDIPISVKLGSSFDSFAITGSATPDSILVGGWDSISTEAGTPVPTSR